MTVSKNMPIAVMDSGIGGTTVLKELIKIMPNENFIYFGDSKNAPYGTKTVDEVRELTTINAEALIARGIKGLVIACNTATAAAGQHLRQLHPEIPIIGIEPAIKPAALAKENPVVLVMATPLTLKQEKFMTLLHKYTDVANIITLPCPGLAELIEAGDFDSDEINSYLQRIFEPLNREKIDSIVMGCTHYPLIQDAIIKNFGKDVDIFYGGEGTARQTMRRLTERSTLSDSKEKGSVEIINTLGTQEVIDCINKILDM